MIDTIDSTVRSCKDIGMWALDRSIEDSCVHRTVFCGEHCFNFKLYAAFGHTMDPKDERNDAAWSNIDGASAEALGAAMARKRSLSPDRFRLMTRGEAFKDATDIARVQTVAAAMPNRLIWIPTRAWMDTELRRLIDTEIRDVVDNVVVLASLDPTNNAAQLDSLTRDGWSTMFFGEMPGGWSGPVDGFKCPKTYRKIKGHCADCVGGCFAEKTIGRRVDVLLKQH
jgi:hypothetical protein